MMKIIVTLSLLFSMLGSMACGIQGSDMGSDTQKIEAADGPTISSADHNCPLQGTDTHHEGAPCGDHCHHHGHCHCGFLVISSKITSPSSDSTQGMNFDTFHPNPHPHINNLFRPPII